MNQEVETQFHKADLAYVRQAMQAPMLHKDQEKLLTEAWAVHQDETSLHLLIHSYSRLVVSQALRFRYYGFAISDLIQEGNIGLLYAASRFDPNREVRFSTYAKWWIKSSIQDFVLRNWSIVRTGTTTAQKQLFFNLRRLRSQLSSLSSGGMTLEAQEKIADLLKVPIKEVQDMENRLAAHDFSLNQPINDSTTDQWMDSLEDERPNPESQVFLTHDALVRRDWLEVAVKNLNPREQVIIRSRRLSDYPITLEDLGKKLQVSKERVRQLETKALRKLRYLLTRNIQDLKDVL